MTSVSNNRLPSALPQGTLRVSSRGIESAGTLINRIQRAFIPGFSAKQDLKVANYFLNYFKEFLRNEDQFDPIELKNGIAVAEQYFAQNKGKSIHIVPEKMARLYHYIFAAKSRLPDVYSSQNLEDARFINEIYNINLLNKWREIGFSRESFRTSPDLVDFIFQSHLHRFIRHADYQHDIPMLPVYHFRNRALTCVQEPHLKVNGQMMPWSKISKQICIDDEDRLYSNGPNGNKIYWMYLDEGLTQWDRHSLTQLKPFKKLSSPPASSQVQVVTSHLPKERWSLFDYPFKGSVHTHFRIIPRNGFRASHPQENLVDGGVYSIGYGGRWADVSHGQPLRTIEGKFYNPDSTEFFKEDLLITTLDVTDAQLLKIQEIAKRNAQQLRPFHVVTHNCCTETTEILKEAGVVDLKSDIRGDRWLYKIIVPKFLRKRFDAVGAKIANALPQSFSQGFSDLVFKILAAAFSPLLLAFGAGSVKRSTKDAQGDLPPMLRNKSDIFNPDRFTVNLTSNVKKWQKKQANTIYIKQK